MTDWELVDKTIKNEPTERAPVGFWSHFLDEAETGDASLDESLAAKNVEGHRKRIAECQPDLVKIMSDGFFHYPVPGGAESLTSLESLNSVEVLAGDHLWIRAQVELVKAVRSMKKDTFYFYNVFSPATTLRFMLGRPRFTRLLKEEPNKVKAVLDRMAMGLEALSKAVIVEGGADGLYLSVQNPDVTVFSDDFYRRWLAAGELYLLASSNQVGGRSILHICGYGGVRNNLACFSDYPASIFSWAVNVEGVSLGEGRRIFGGKAVLGGFPNVDGSILQTGDKPAIADFTRKLLAEAGPTGVIVGADCTIPPHTPIESLEWVREAAWRNAGRTE
ncbi:MAG: uroporphyrinogen decarboxylase [Deltaproteobacteria bacterium]|jgi:uroporphyrinogen decarboxylase|nr:uroporphyrinogen decarboxylase [Deltaproteobacteria bacterium]